MLALTIPDIKAFMGKLLNTDTFDDFLLQEAIIKTAATFHLDGHLNRDFYSGEEWEDASSGAGLTAEERETCLSGWKRFRSLCFSLIKGKRAPLLFKAVLIYSPAASRRLLADAGAAGLASLVRGFVLTMRYDERGLMLTTSASLTAFVMDKAPEHLWDEAFRRILTKRGIAFHE